MLDESIRGYTGDIHKQITITFNPWNERHWLNARFFKNNPIVKEQYDENGELMAKTRMSEDGEIMAKTTNYKCNEWADEHDRALFERMKIQNPRRYQVAGLGHWGIVDGLIYENWREEEFDYQTIKNRTGIQEVFGLDFGFSDDPTAFIQLLVDTDKLEIYVVDEFYETHLSNKDIAHKLMKMRVHNEIIRADNNEPKSISELRDLGINRIRRARKGRDSVNHGIQYIQNYEIIIHPRCNNFITEISNYQWKEDNTGTRLSKPADDMDHLMDAMRYAMEDISRGSVYSFS